MTNKEKMAFWKGGDSSEVLRFTNPYEYEDCIIGVSTDGRAVYDFMKVMEYVYEQEKDYHDINDFDDEDDLRYTIMKNAEEMINHDLSCYNPADKIPVFCQTEEDTDDDEFLIDDSPYGDFYSCTLGPDFREYRYIFSLSKMVDSLMKEYGMGKEEAVTYVYSLKKAGTVEQGVFNYIIVDDLYETVSISNGGFQENNNKYSLEFEKESFEFKGKDFLCAINKINEMFRFTRPTNFFLNYIKIKKVVDSSSKVFIDATDGKLLTRFSLDLKTESSFDKPFFLSLNFISFLSTKIGENDNVQIFAGNECLFVKVNEEIYSISIKEMKYPAFERVIPENNPFTAEISVEDIKPLFDSIEDEKSLETLSVKFIFTEDKLILKMEDLEKSIPCSYTCEEVFSVVFNARFIKLLTNFYSEKILLEFKDVTTPFKINKDGMVTVLMSFHDVEK